MNYPKATQKQLVYILKLKSDLNIMDWNFDRLIKDACGKKKDLNEITSKEAGRMIGLLKNLK